MEGNSLHVPNLNALRAELTTGFGTKLAGAFEDASSKEEARAKLHTIIDAELASQELTLRDAEDPVA